MRGVWLIILIVLFYSLSFGQTVVPYTGLQTTTYTVTGTGAPINLIGSGITYQKIAWNIQGAPASCQVQVDSSVDGITYNNADVVGSTACTANGTVTAVAFVANFMRVKVTAITAASTLTVTWTGYPNNPGGGGGAAVNPTSGVLPYNNAGTFADSPLSTNGTVLTSTISINAPTLSTGTTPAGVANTATGGFACTEGTTTGWTPTAGTTWMRCDNGHKFVWSVNGGAEGPLPVNSGGTGLGSGTSGGIPAYTAAGTLASSGALTANVLVKGGGAGATPTNSLHTDDGTTDTYTGTGGAKAPAFTATGTTAGFADYPQGTTSAAVQPCNTANSICVQAPTSVTAQLRTLAGTPATGFQKWTNTAGSMVETIAALANTDLPAQLTSGTKTGIFNFNQAAQSQVVVSATEYYITNSDIDMPAAYATAIGAGTTMNWRVAMTKTAAGTGTFQIFLKKGTNGSTADTSVATITIGTQTAIADNMEMDVSLTWTSATAAYWTVIPHQAAATGTGFGLVYPAAAAQFSGTISGQTTTTASDKYGLSFKATTGTPTIVVNMVKAQAFGVN